MAEGLERPACMFLLQNIQHSFKYVIQDLFKQKKPKKADWGNTEIKGIKEGEKINIFPFSVIMRQLITITQPLTATASACCLYIFKFIYAVGEGCSEWYHHHETGHSLPYWHSLWLSLPSLWPPLIFLGWWSSYWSLISFLFQVPSLFRICTKLFSSLICSRWGNTGSCKGWK